MDDDFIRYAGLMIKKGSGKRIYWGMDDIPMNDSGAREFESTLTSHFDTDRRHGSRRQFHDVAVGGSDIIVNHIDILVTADVLVIFAKK